MSGTAYTDVRAHECARKNAQDCNPVRCGGGDNKTRTYDLYDVNVAL